MKTVLILHGGDKRFLCAVPYETAEYVIAKTDCPICAGKHVFTNSATMEAVVVDPKLLLTFQAEEMKKPELWEERPENPPHFVKLRGTSPVYSQKDCKGKATCLRCHNIIGVLHIKFNTLFGREEDARVQQRVRVY